MKAHKQIVVWFVLDPLKVLDNGVSSKLGWGVWTHHTEVNTKVPTKVTHIEALESQFVGP
jgi:hypothetical protein